MHEPTNEKKNIVVPIMLLMRSAFGLAVLLAAAVEALPIAEHRADHQASWDAWTQAHNKSYVAAEVGQLIFCSFDSPTGSPQIIITEDDAYPSLTGGFQVWSLL